MGSRGAAAEGVAVAATGGEVLQRAAADLGLAPAALAPAVSDPAYRVLAGGPGQAVLLRRQWTVEGTPEAVVLAAAGMGPDHPAVGATAVGWGCDRVRDRPGGRGVRPVAQPGRGEPLVDRFLAAAALAATRVETAVALARGTGEDRVKADGSPALAADEAAHTAAVGVLAALEVPVLSEERLDVAVEPGEPWIVLDPLDGTGNFRAGLPPWAFSAGLVHEGHAVAGVVVDLSSGRRWSGSVGSGARRDDVPIGPRAGTTVVVPSAPGGRHVGVPTTARRIRVTGCTAVEVCLVADGSAAAWHDLDRSGTHVHDVAGGLAVLAAAGGVALTADGAPLRLEPDTETKIRFAAAGTEEAARELIEAVTRR
ncbi:inositol monophosphatase family protein [Blastococcus sp. SYSU D00695]